MGSYIPGNDLEDDLLNHIDDAGFSGSRQKISTDKMARITNACTRQSGHQGVLGDGEHKKLIDISAAKYKKGYFWDQCSGKPAIKAAECARDKLEDEYKTGTRLDLTNADFERLSLLSSN